MTLRSTASSNCEDFVMHITGTTSKSLLGYIDRVAEFFSVYDVDIDFVDSLDGLLGICSGDTNWCFIEIARKDAWGRVPMDQLKLAIAHEMTHAWQMLEGRFTGTEWEGVCYKGVDYKDLPWEHEAYEMERIVYEDCK